MNKDTRIYLERELKNIEREKAKIVLEKSFALYFLFMLIAVIGFVFNYISKTMLNVLIILGILILIAGTIPYAKAVRTEENMLRKLLK